jgi:nucleotide-binding universal stress UspA family protein
MNASKNIDHILVPHDLHECSDAALDYALRLAKQFGARITVLHAYELPSMGAPEVMILATDWTKQIGLLAGEELKRVVTRAQAAHGGGVTVEAELREGTAWREVDKFAEERGVSLIVVGSHGRRGLPHAILGSVAEKIVRTAPCPVLVVRGKQS